MDYLFIFFLLVLVVLALRLDKGDQLTNDKYYRLEPAEDGCAHEVDYLVQHREPGCPTGTCIAGDTECQHGFGMNHWDHPNDIARFEPADASGSDEPTVFDLHTEPDQLFDWDRHRDEDGTCVKCGHMRGTSSCCVSFK